VSNIADEKKDLLEEMLRRITNLGIEDEDACMKTGMPHRRMPSDLWQD
jgi:hypothetical protein